MKKIIGVFVFLFLLIAPVWAADPTIAQLDLCKSTKARAFLPTLQANVRLKSDATTLQPKISQIDTNRFCDCIFSEYKKTFGVEETAEMMSFPLVQGSTEELLKIEGQKNAIYFMCFGRQIGQPALKPPTPLEVHKTLTTPNANTQRNDLVRATKLTLAKLKSEVLLYQLNQQKWPSQLSDLPGLNAKDFTDAWGHPITIEPQGTEFKLISAGPDGQKGTGDDLTLP